MSRNRDLNSRYVDAAPAGDGRTAPGIESLAAWADQLRSELVSPIPDDVAAAHLASIAAAAGTIAGPQSQITKPTRRERLRRRLVFSSLLSGVFAKVFAASVALATVTGGVVATGSLPDSVQDPIAGLYNAVGFNFPTSTSGGDSQSDDVEEIDDGVEAPAPTAGTSDPAVDPDDDSDDNSDDDGDSADNSDDGNGSDDEDSEDNSGADDEDSDDNDGDDDDSDDNSEDNDEDSDDNDGDDDDSDDNSDDNDGDDDNSEDHSGRRNEGRDRGDNEDGDSK